MFGRVRRLTEDLDRKRERIHELRERILTLERWIDEHATRERAIHVSLAREREKCVAAEKRADIAQNSFEWARVRLNQVEEERALLISTMLKAPIGALEIQRRLTPEQGEGLPHVPDGLFDDVGDDVAQSLGLNEDVTHG